VAGRPHCRNAGTAGPCSGAGGRPATRGPTRPWPVEGSLRQGARLRDARQLRQARGGTVQECARRDCPARGAHPEASDAARSCDAGRQQRFTFSMPPGPPSRGGPAMLSPRACVVGPRGLRRGVEHSCCWARGLVPMPDGVHGHCSRRVRRRSISRGLVPKTRAPRAQKLLGRAHSVAPKGFWSCVVPTVDPAARMLRAVCPRSFWCI